MLQLGRELEGCSGRRKAWIPLCRQSKSWQPTKWNVICSENFMESHFQACTITTTSPDEKHRKKLIKGAVWSVFVRQPRLIRSASPKPRRTVVRTTLQPPSRIPKFVSAGCQTELTVDDSKDMEQDLVFRRDLIAKRNYEVQALEACVAQI